MRVLVVLLLGCGLAEGRLVTKCELMRDLMEVMMQQKGLADENFVAKSKCELFTLETLKRSAAGLENCLIFLVIVCKK